MRGNPVLARLIRGSGWPSPGLCWRLAAGLALITLPPGAYELDRVLHHGADPGVTSFLAGLGWLIAVALPPTCAVSAASLARRATGNGEYDLLRLSRVGPAQIVAGFLGGALFRLRLVIAAVAGLLPALILGTTTSVMYVLIHQSLAAPVFGAPVQQYKPVPLDVWAVVAQIASVGLGLCIFTLFSGELGLALGFNHRSAAIGGIGAAGAMTGSLVAVITILAALHAPMSGIGVSGLPDPTLQIAFPALFCMGLPALLLAPAFWLARRRVFRGAK